MAMNPYAEQAASPGAAPAEQADPLAEINQKLDYIITFLQEAVASGGEEGGEVEEEDDMEGV